MLAQRPSQSTSQQNGSVAHTAWQQTGSSQPGVPLAKQQLPWPGPQGSAVQVHSAVTSAVSAQRLSQSVLQQYGSVAQTAWQQAGSSQPAEPLAAQQAPAPGAQVFFGQLHMAWAIAAQVPSQSVSQQ